MDAIKVANLRTSQLTDDEVIQKVLDGEKELFEILMRRYNQTLYRGVRSYLNDEDLVKDVMQDTYLKAFEKLSQFQRKSAFATWLIRIGINEALLRIRNAKRDRSIFTEIKEEAMSIFQRSGIYKMNPEKRIIQKETRGMVEHAIDQLPEKYRVVYVLREVEGIENEEIASCLGLTYSNVKVRLHRAKSLLKKKLQDVENDKNVFGFGNEHCDQLVSYVMNKILGTY